MQRVPLRAARLLVVFSLVILTGCAQGLAFQSEPSVELAEPALSTEKLAILYYSTREGSYLVPVRAKVSNGDYLARHVVEKLLAGPEDKELLVSPFPAGVLLRDVYIKNGIACVDLGGISIQDLKEMDCEMWCRAVDSLVLTLTELPGQEIESVEILINGASKKDTLFQHPDCINLIASKDVAGVQAATLFYSYNDTYLVPVTIDVDQKVADRTAFILNQLIAGPQGIPHLSRVFAEGARLLDYQQEGDLIRLNFSREVVERDTRGNISREEQSPTVLALALTLRSIPGIDRFQILIEGKPLSDVVCPLKVPKDYLDDEWMGSLLKS